MFLLQLNKKGWFNHMTEIFILITQGVIGETGTVGLSGDTGPKGIRGRSGNLGLPGQLGQAVR